ncbi:MAG: hypothetical protein ACP5NW_01530 [Candidatus Woesearchaeota archaeon]
MKPARIIFSEEATLMFNYISERAVVSKSERTMNNAILQKIEWIKSKPQCGQSISKDLLPREYILKYDIQNLYRIELPNFWRMLYTLRDNKIEIIAFVLDILDHKKYNRKLKYKK